MRLSHARFGHVLFVALCLGAPAFAYTASGVDDATNPGVENPGLDVTRHAMPPPDVTAPPAEAPTVAAREHRGRRHRTQCRRARGHGRGGAARRGQGRALPRRVDEDDQRLALESDHWCVSVSPFPWRAEIVSTSGRVVTGPTPDPLASFTREGRGRRRTRHLSPPWLAPVGPRSGFSREILGQSVKSRG